MGNVLAEASQVGQNVRSRRLGIGEIPRRIMQQSPIVLPSLPEPTQELEEEEYVEVQEEPTRALSATTIRRPTASWD